MTIFIIFIGEDWNSIMHQHYRAQETTFVFVYFVSLFVIGNMILMNLFLAILLKNFEEPPGSDTAEDEAENDQKITVKKIVMTYLCCCCKG